jgi:glycosyltransferase involved in cell wall biosynthesis
MYRKKRISLVIPAHNEEKLIRPTLEHVPELIDRIYVIDDGSTDNMVQVVRECMQKDKRIKLIQHEKNLGCGQGVITGYKASLAEGYDIAVVVGGDYQMPLDQVTNLLDPIIAGQADYAKGCRFLEDSGSFKNMPKLRLVANMIISALTKIASGYYKIIDVVDGYTAITRRAIELVNWDKAWKGYGYPMDFLIRLNERGLRVVDVPRRAIYLPGERQSQIKGVRYALRVSPMLVRGFFRRILYKYIVRDFHPLAFFYLIGLILAPTGLIYGLVLVWRQLVGIGVTGPQAIMCALLLIMGVQFTLFAMLFDMQESG